MDHGGAVRPASIQMTVLAVETFTDAIRILYSCKGRMTLAEMNAKFENSK